MSAGKMNLRPFERRLLVGVLVVLLLVVNFVFIWPHFGDWAKTQDRLNKAFPMLYRRGAPGYQLIYDDAGWRLFERTDATLAQEASAVSRTDQGSMGGHHAYSDY
jgi:hypothetical protein